MRSDRLILGIGILVFLAAYTAVVFAFFSAPEGESQLIYLALAGLPLGIALFIYPQAALIILGALIYSVGWLSEYWSVIPREATWLIDILLVLLVARTLLFMPIHHERIRGPEKLIYLALAFALLSAVVNGESRATLFIGMRVAFRYLMLFIAVYRLGLSRRFVRGFILYLFLIGLIQTPIILVQYHYLGWDDPDTLCGTFGRNQTPGIGIFLLTLFSFLAAMMIEDRRFRISFLLMIVWMSVAPVLGEVKFYFMILPLLIAFLVRSEFFKRPMIAVGMVFVGIALIYAVDYVILQTGGWAEGRNPLTYMQHLPDVFTKEMEEPQETSFERSYTFVYGLRLAAETPLGIFLGNGCGSITRSYVSPNHSPRAAYFARWGLSSNTTSIPWLLIEYGYVGTLLFLYILWSIFRRGRVLRRSADRELRIYGRTLEGMTFLFGAWLFYTNAWQTDGMSFVFWPLAAMLVYLSYQEEAVQERAAANARMKEIKQPVPDYIPQALR